MYKKSIIFSFFISLSAGASLAKISPESITPPTIEQFENKSNPITNSTWNPGAIPSHFNIKDPADINNRRWNLYCDTNVPSNTIFLHPNNTKTITLTLSSGPTLDSAQLKASYQGTLQQEKDSVSVTCTAKLVNPPAHCQINSQNTHEWTCF